MLRGVAVAAFTIFVGPNSFGRDGDRCAAPTKTNTIFVRRWSLQRDRAAAELDDPPRDENASFGIDGEPEPATAPDRIALGDGERPRTRRAGRDQPAAEVGAGRAGSRVL